MADFAPTADQIATMKPVADMWNTKFAAMPEAFQTSMNAEFANAENPEWVAKEKEYMTGVFEACDADKNGRHNRAEFEALCKAVDARSV